MANVEVQLDITADYKAAMMAIANLGKALDAVQARAKLVAPAAAGGAGGGQNGGQDSGEQNKVLEERKAAMAALGESMKAAAAAAAELSDAIGKLSPALAEMGPQDEQVQRVTVLAGHYKELATAMGIAADAAAKYNSSGAQQGEIDDRVRKLAEENQALLDKITAMREEFDALKQMTKELQQNRAERAAAAKAAKEEMEVEKDLSYEMQLAAMNKQQLTEEIKRLTEERKKAAAAGEKEQATYEARTAELQLARKALTKLRQEESLMRIMWMQQAQAAQQIGTSIKTVAEGVASFSENAKNGTLSLNGMVSSVMSLAYQLKAGLGPLGWVLLAVEGLTMAWNHYAREQAEAERKMRAREKAEAEAMLRLRHAHDEARKALREYNDEDAHRADMSRLAAQHERINDALRERNELQAKNLRMLEAEQALQANEDELALTLERGKIMRQYWSGEIDETQRDNALDELRKREVRQQQKRALQSERWRVEARQEALRTAEYESSSQTASYEAQRRRFREDFGVSAEEARHIVATNDLTRSEIEEIKAKIRAVYDEMEPLIRAQNAIAEPEKLVGDAAREFDERAEMLDSLSEEIDSLKEVQTQLEAQIRERNEALGEWSERQVRTGEYAREMAQAEERLAAAERSQITATNNATAAREAHAAALEQQSLVTRQQAQRVAHVDARVEEDRRNREAQAAHRERLRREAEMQRNAEREAEEARRRREERDAVYNAATAYSNALEPGETRRALRWALGEGTRQVESGRYNDATVRRLLTALQLFQQTSSSADDKVVDMLLQQITDLKRLKESTQRRLLDLQ